MISSKLHKNEYVDYAPSNPGEQIHINHENCPAGTDTKRRLFIRRTDDGQLILAYCHNCGKHGAYSESFSKARLAKKGVCTTSPSNRSGYSLPYDSNGDIRTWPPQASTWIYRYQLTEQEVKDNGIVYADSVRRVVLPVYDGDGLALLQKRRIFSGADKAPKYVSCRNRSAIFHKLCSSGICAPTNRVVLCEDILSAIKCSRYCNSIALLGTSLSDGGLGTIIKAGYTEFIVWLDDDNRQVKLAQTVLKNKLELFGTVRIIKGVGKDPKECNDDELKRILL